MPSIADLDVAGHCIGAALSERSEDGANEAGIDDGIGIHGHDKLVTCRRDPFIKRVGLTHRAWKSYAFHARVFKSHLAEDGGCAVTGSIVDCDDLQRNDIASQQGTDRCANHHFFVQGGNNHRHANRLTNH